MPDVYVKLREGGLDGGLPVPADGRVRLTPVLVPDGEAWVTSAPTVLDVVGGVAEPVSVSAGRWRVDVVSERWARRWELDIEESAEPVNLVTLTPIDPATPVPWLPTEDDLLFIRETRDRIPELIEEAVAEGDYTGPPGPTGRGIESVTGEGSVATVTFTDGTTATFPLPPGEDGDDGLSAYQQAVADGFEGTLTEWLESLHGADGPAPSVEWDGPHLVVGDQRSPDLTGPASTVPGPAPEVAWDGPVLVVGGERSPDLTGPAGDGNLIGPGRPDQPTTTGGLVDASTPVGTTYVSTDGAGVGAHVWLRTAGGWIVTAGDTGWRVISLGPPFRDHTLQFRRVGAVVYGLPHEPSSWGSWADLPLQETLTLDAGTTPAGFRQGDMRYVAQLLSTAGETNGVVYLLAPPNEPRIRIIVNTPGSSILSMQWTTPDPWPTTLPGSPA